MHSGRFNRAAVWIKARERRPWVALGSVLLRRDVRVGRSLFVMAVITAVMEECFEGVAEMGWESISTGEGEASSGLVSGAVRRPLAGGEYCGKSSMEPECSMNCLRSLVGDFTVALVV